MSDDDVWDRVVDFAIRFGGALALGKLFFLDFLILDVHWKKAMLISWIVIGCTAASLGVWTMRKIGVSVTIYAVGYLVGALPALEVIGAFLTRALR
jgi:hypothetical protein